MAELTREILPRTPHRMPAPLIMVMLGLGAMAGAGAATYLSSTPTDLYEDALPSTNRIIAALQRLPGVTSVTEGGDGWVYALRDGRDLGTAADPQVVHWQRLDFTATSLQMSQGWLVAAGPGFVSLSKDHGKTWRTMTTGSYRFDRVHVRIVEQDGSVFVTGEVGQESVLMRGQTSLTTLDVVSATCIDPSHG
jgi:hypothetical protein